MFALGSDGNIATRDDEEAMIVYLFFVAWVVMDTLVLAILKYVAFSAYQARGVHLGILNKESE